MKKLFITLAALFAAFNTCAYAQTIEITIDSPVVYTLNETIEKSELEAATFISNDITMIPLRFVSEKLGAEVEWDGDKREVLCKKDGKTIKLTIDSKDAEVKEGEETKTKELLSAPVIVNNRTFVPLRFISENFNAYVEYVEPTRQVLITDEEAALYVNGKRVDKGMIQAYYNLNDAYIPYYGPESYFDSIYKDVVSMVAFETKWNVIDPDNSIPTELLEEIKAINSDELANIGVLKSYLVKLQIADSKINKAMTIMQGSFTEQQINDCYDNTFVCAKHILLSTVNNETGEPVSDTEKAKIKKKAEGILAKLKKGGDFDKLMAENSEDPGSKYYPDGYVFTGGEMVEEFEKATFELADNELSGIVESIFGYHIIKRVPLPEIDDETKQKVEGQLINLFVNDLMANPEIKESTSYQELYEAITQEESEAEPAE